MKNYGKELILDLHKVKNVHLFNRKDLKKFFVELCDFIDMKRCDLHFWDYKGYKEEYKNAPIHLQGTSAIQFISTSNITVHTLDKMKRVYINIFSCKKFDSTQASQFCAKYFNATIITQFTIDRK